MNQSNWYNFNTVDLLILNISWLLMSSEKTIHWWSPVGTTCHSTYETLDILLELFDGKIILGGCGCILARG